MEESLCDMEFGNPFDSMNDSSLLSDFSSRGYVDDTYMDVPVESYHSSHKSKSFKSVIENSHYSLNNYPDLSIDQEWDASSEFLMKPSEIDSVSSKFEDASLNSNIQTTSPTKVNFNYNENYDDSLNSSTETSWKNPQFQSNFNNSKSIFDNHQNNEYEKNLCKGTMETKYSNICHIEPSSLSSLPTPPYSPRSSSTSDPELDKIIKKYPEILNELPARSSPKFQIILDDLEKFTSDTMEGKQLEDGLPSCTEFYNENLEDCSLFPSLPVANSDYLPNDTFTDTDQLLSPAHTKTPSCFSTSETSKLERERLSVNFEHNYCLSSPRESYSHKLMLRSDLSSCENVPQPKQIRKASRRPLTITQEKQVDSLWSDYLLTSEAKSSCLPHVNTSTAQLKKQLQTIIKGKSKQVKGRVGRPPKMENFIRNIPSTNHRCERKIIRGELNETMKKVAAANVNVSESRKKRTAANDPDDDLERRANHNTMERCRRNCMKQQFQTLRSLIPQICSNPKASKALILKAALHYVRELESQEVEQLNKITYYNKKNSVLKKQIEAYRKGIPSKF